MRELTEEEIAVVHGGSANISGLPTDWNVGHIQNLGSVELMFGDEIRALNKLPVHTLMDQMRNDS